MSDINTLVFEAVNRPSRFRTKMLKKTIGKQRNVYAGQLASNLAKQRSPSLAARKQYYRQRYLEMKKREQQMYGSRAKSLSKRR